ncbi:MAG: hypothetical protein R8K53_09220 [Mariprofundaceae bacterium]
MDVLEKKLVPWLIEHAPLLGMCKVGGWPDFEHMHVEICDQNSSEWRIIVDFDEHIREISVCEPVVHNRCAKFAISLDEQGAPVAIRLIAYMS